MEAEFGRPQWVFGANCYGFVSADRAICAVNRSGVWGLLDVDLESGRSTELDIGGYSAMGRSDLRVAGDKVFFEAGGPMEPNALLRLDLGSGRLDVVRRSNPAGVDPEYLSAPETIEFPTEGGLTAPRVLLSAPEPGLCGAGGSQAPFAAEEPRRSDGCHVQRARPGDSVLDEPGVCGGGRELRREHRVRQRVPPAVGEELGCRGRGRLCQRSPAPGFAGSGRREATGDRRGQRGRVHHAGGTDLPRHFLRRGQLLRGERPRDPGARHPQVRVPLPGHAGWGPIRKRPASTGSGRR